MNPYIAITLLIGIGIWELLRYLLRKPDAMDIRHGIFCWSGSYRRRFFRTLAMIPVCVAILAWGALSEPRNVSAALGGGVLTMIIGIQVIYNYIKWKAGE